MEFRRRKNFGFPNQTIEREEIPSPSIFPRRKIERRSHKHDMGISVLPKTRFFYSSNIREREERMIPKEEDYNWALIIIPFFPSRNTFFSGKEVECMSTYGVVDLTQTQQQHQHILFPIHFSPFSSPQKEGKPNNVLYTFSSFPFSRIERRATDVDHNSKEETKKKPSNSRR